MSTDLQQRLDDYRGGRPGPAVPARWPRRRVLLAAGLAAAVLAGGAVAALTAAGRDPGAAAPSRPEADGGAAPAAAPADPGPGGGFAWREWTSPGLVSLQLPSSPAAGPADPDAAAGFARTPDGALAAAATLHPLIYFTRDWDRWTALAEDRVVWADGQREQLQSALAEAWDIRGAVTPAVPVGYLPIAYTGDRAVFRIWWQYDGRPTGIPTKVIGALVEVRWDGGDWKLRFDEPAADMRAARPGEQWTPFGPGAAA